jgi:glycosyltransferase involved in cell wall biosynthesis
VITQDAEMVFRKGSLEPKVTIIIALYNYERHIAEALDSVAAQTAKDCAIVVVNDCSTDRSLQAAEEWMRQDRHSGLGMLLLSHRQNAGAAIARNTGIMSSRSEFCFILDADNILYPRCIEKHLVALDGRPDACAAYGLIEVFDGEQDLFGTGVFAEEGLINGNFIDVMALYRRKKLLDLNGFEKIKHGWEDYDLWLRILEGEGIALHIPEITARYRHHRSSITRTEQNSGSILELHKEMLRRHPQLKLH